MVENYLLNEKVYFIYNAIDGEYCNHVQMTGIKKRLVELGDSAEATDVVFIFRELIDVLGWFFVFI